VQLTGDGPLVTPLAPGETRALALRWTALERPLTLEPLARAARAQSGPELVEAFAGLVGPVLNVAWADRDGRVGYKLVGGPVPLRAAGDGRVPLDAGAGAGWRGTIPDAELPGHADPDDGVVVTANNRIADEPYPHFLSAEWLPPYRAERIAELLAAAGAVSVADCTRIQVDVRSLPGLRLRELARRYGAAGNPRARRAHALLLEWDGQLDAGSPGGAVYGVLARQLAYEVFREAGVELERFLGATGFTELSSTLGFYGRYLPRLLDLLDAADDGFFRDGRTWPEVFERCLERTAAELDERLGEDAARWRWGDLHALVLDHPLAALPGIARVVRRGPFPLPGDADTVWQARQPPHDPVSGRHTTGPGMRYVTDLGDPDATRFVLCGGQSGHPGSPAYADQVDDWLAGRTRQLAWSDDAIAALARAAIDLEPVR
jgi:penicillin amidase